MSLCRQPLFPLVIAAALFSFNSLAYSANMPEAQTPQQMILSMKAAIAMAVRKNLDLRIEAQNSKMASLDAIKSTGIYNPVLTASGSGGVTAVPGEAFFSTKNMTSSVGLTQNLPTGGNISAETKAGYFRFEPTTTPSKEWQSTAGLALTQPLLKNAWKETYELNITLSTTQQHDALERFRAATIDTVSNVITAYNHLYVLRQIQDTREAALVSAQRLLEEVKKKEASVQALEIANTEFAIAQRRKDFVEASRNASEQETNLRYLIGLDSPMHIVPSDPPSKNEPQENDEQAIKAALELRPDLKQLKTSLQSAMLQERVAGKQTLPELSVNATGGVTGTGYNFGESYRQIRNHPGTYWTAGLQFSLPLGNTTARNEYIKNKIRTEQAQDQIRALSWKIRNDVENDMRALISARLQIQLSEKSSQFAEQRTEQYRKNNLIKMASIQDVLNAENDLNVARNTHLEAIEAFSNAVTKLWKDTGLLLDRYGIHIDSSQCGAVASGRESSLTSMIDQLTAAEPMQDNAEWDDQAAPAPGAGPADSVQNGTSAKANTQVVPPHSGTPAASKTYTLAIGEYTAKHMMADAIKKLESVGLVPLVTQGAPRAEQVFRLNLGDYPNNLQAQKALKKIQLFKANGFIQLNEKQRYVVYAGSFFDQEAAVKEQARLAGHNIRVRPEKTSAKLPTFLLSAGNFLGREAALKFASRLEQEGLKPVVTEKP